jgi:hypothetical protein
MIELNINIQEMKDFIKDTVEVPRKTFSLHLI